MSVEATAHVFKARIGEPKAKLVLVALSDAAGEDDEVIGEWRCAPSLEHLAEIASMSLAEVEESLAWLRAEGWIEARRPVGDRRQFAILRPRETDAVRRPAPETC